MKTPAWLEHAACRNKPLDLWYPIESVCGRDYEIHAGKWRHAARELADQLGQPSPLTVCFECPVRQPCRDEAIRDKDYHGIRGGLTPPELRAIGGARRNIEPADHGTHSRYTLGCRCDRCREANTQHARNLRRVS